MALLFLIMFNSNYFMEIQNKNKQDEFTTLKNFKVHNTEFTDVCTTRDDKRKNLRGPATQKLFRGQE